MGNGGAERVLSILASELSKRNHDVSIVMIFGNRVDYELDSKVKLIPIECKGTSSCERAFQRIKELRKILKQHRDEIIVSLLSDVNMYTLVSGIGIKKRMILCDRNDPNHDPNTRFKRMIRNLLYRYAYGYIFQTDDAKDYYKKIIGRKPNAVIPNPIKDSLPYYHEDTEKKVIISACRLTEQKNIPMLLKAFSIVREAEEFVTLEIYGEGPLKNSMQAYAEELGIAESVSFLGYTPNIHRVMQNASVFTLSSDYEGISNAMLEALAIGIPVVVTDCPVGGAKMFIENDVNGILVPVGDYCALANSLLYVLKHRDKALRMGSNAINIRKRLSTDSIVDNWEDFLQKAE